MDGKASQSGARSLLSKLQALPKNAEPVVSRHWHSLHEAFTDVARGIRVAAEKLKREIEERQQHLQRQQEETEKLRQQQEAEKLQRKKEAERRRRMESTRLHGSSGSSELPLASDKGVDYTRLRDLLKTGQWKKADQETLAVMLKVANRKKEGWLNMGSIEEFSCTDLRTIDQLWVKYSNGRYGFSVQKKIWLEVGENWNAFYTCVGWQITSKWMLGGWINEKSISYDNAAPLGHLPGSPFAVSQGSPFRVRWDESMNDLINVECGISALCRRIRYCNI
ncbi:GUN4 domain-containing protein [Atlanticothrix silvestris]|nr:GUN4 domain-containing protein [Atlanticothrix silvestris]